MSPEEVRELLPLYALGALSPEERKRVEKALERYPELWPEAKALLEAASELSSGLPPEPVPPGLEARVLRRLRARRPILPLLTRVAAVLVYLVLGYGAYFGLFWTLSLGAPTTRVFALVNPEGQGVGHVVVRQDGRALVVLQKGAPPGRVYQAWGLGNRDPMPLSTFRLPLKVLKLPPEAQALAVSLEPPGGSLSPTQILGLPRPQVP
ncbi:anti-sigma E factor [Thermus sp. LT1-2-5]|uniref:anti-sigma factor n=1 Tax=Thermus sp. LT1-2-5 TaxID=3026935 RepID=UPI0030E896C0